MPISIRNPRVEELARRAARETGKSMTQVIIDALEQELARIESGPAMRLDLEQIMSISRRCAALSTRDSRPEVQILGYDDMERQSGH